MTSKIRSLQHRFHLRSACGPLIETLENRTLLSVSAADGLLSITGTSGDDKINVRAAPENTSRVAVNKGVSIFNKADVTSIFVDALGGNDRVEIQAGGPDGTLTVPATVLGGAGNDTLSGASGDDRLVGGDGDDLLLGTKGNDTLLGSNGIDQLQGGDGDDFID